MKKELHGKELKNHMDRVHRSQQIRFKLLEAMGADNNCKFVPCNEHQVGLTNAIFDLLQQGFRFTEYRIGTIAYGEQTEQENLLKPYAAGPRLDKILGEIFDGCRNCQVSH